MAHLAVIALLFAQDKPVARWGKIEKDTRFTLEWDFSLKYTDEIGTKGIRRKDERKVTAELVADSDIDGKGSLRIELMSVSWVYANSEFEIKITRDKAGTMKDSVKVTAPKETAANAETEAKAKVEALKKLIEREYALLVGPSSSRVGGGWSAGDVFNGLFDYMMTHDDLGEAGRTAGESWETDPAISDGAGGGGLEPKDWDAKTQLKASAAGKGVKVTGTLSWTASDSDGIGGPAKAKHAMKKDWTLVDGYFAGGHRTIARSYQREGDGKLWEPEATTFSLKETLTIKKK